MKLFNNLDFLFSKIKILSYFFKHGGSFSSNAIRKV